MLDRFFLAHPRSVDESYVQHMRMAGGFGVAMIMAGIACLVHAVVPGLFARTGSDAIARLHHRMLAGRDRSRPDGAAPQSVR